MALSFKLIMIIVPHGEGEEVDEILKEFGANVTSSYIGSGTANSDILQVFVGNVQKDVTTAIMPSERVPAVLGALREKLDTSGIVFTIKLSSIGDKNVVDLINSGGK